MEPQVKKIEKEIIFKETWEQKSNRIRSNSPFGSLENWKLLSVIVKVGDDCRQERLGLQLITQMDKIFKDAQLPLFLYPYKMLVLSLCACIIETVPNAISIHQMKREHNLMTLREFYANLSGGEDTEEYSIKRRNFIESLAGYSLVCFFLQIKDRHNGNILIDYDGHVIHIDFGFMLWNSPGMNMNFEAPFKLTGEYVEFMGGKDSGLFHYYKALMYTGFVELRKHSEKIIGLVKLMIQSETKLPCLSGGEQVIKDLADRFSIGLTEDECRLYVETLISNSLDNWRTIQYDKFQRYSNGILF